MIFFKNKHTISAVVVGLGNPGNSYKNNRHNVGFMAVDVLAQKYGETVKKRKFDALTAEINVSGHKVLLLKPQTFMNNSGISVAKVLKFYKLPPQRVVVIYDDIALPSGRLRVRQKGSAGGHNGIKSLIAHCTEHFCRLRIGVGAPKQELVHHVLSDLSKQEQKQLSERMDDICNFCELFAVGEVEKGMNLYSK